VDSDFHLPLDGRARPWRTATLIASAVAAVELVLLVVAAIALFARPLSHHARAVAVKRAAAPKRAPVPARPAPPRAPSLTRSHTSVLVLNGNGVTGAAGAAAGKVRRLGYVVAKVGDASRADYPTSVIMYRPGFRPEGLRLARDLRVKVVGPLDGLRVRQLMGAHVAFIIGH
jgi:LytR cell envelope-related transcriptional attenuator